LAYTPLVSELFFDTDTNRLYIGDGTTAGGVIVGGTSIPLSVINKTANFSAGTGESGTRYTNSGAAGTVIGSLPAATIGLAFALSVITAQILRFAANGTDVITWAGTDSAAGGTIEGNVKGWFLLLECHATGLWTVTQSQGGWTIT
jgi:hypothetical protein